MTKKELLEKFRDDLEVKIKEKHALSEWETIRDKITLSSSFLKIFRIESIKSDIHYQLDIKGEEKIIRIDLETDNGIEKYEKKLEEFFKNDNFKSFEYDGNIYKNEIPANGGKSWYYTCTGNDNPVEKMSELISEVENFLSGNNLSQGQKEKENPMKQDVKSYVALLEANKNLILTGAPGTGKTYKTAEIALSILGKDISQYKTRKDLMEAYDKEVKAEHIAFTTFHQSMDYEEFIEGLKPVITQQGQVTYEVKPGIFKNICEKAKNEKCVLIIDEINRGNVSKIFGELITLLEKDKRLDETNAITVTLPYSQEKEFGVPKNLYIIGTMNTADRSIGHIDYAIRRRFVFASIKADRSVITNEKAQLLFDYIKNFIKEHINEDLDVEDLMIGHSYFLCESLAELKSNLKYKITPLIEEYKKDGIIIVEKKEELPEIIEKWETLLKS
jgi:5-methylcytosine-specific restriction endonuclease McrBC GTP-binding regulatory subunit McrB